MQEEIKAIQEEYFPGKRTPEENKALCEKYPFLKWYGNPLYMGYSEDHEPDYEYTWEDELFHSGPGWVKAFCPQIWDELKEILAKANYVDKFRFVQIKEKWGQLRLYWQGAPNKIWDEVNAWTEKYLELSENICIDCGVNKATHLSLGWVSYVCKDCALKRDEEQLKKYNRGHEHFVRLENLDEYYHNREAYWEKHKDEIV